MSLILNGTSGVSDVDGSASTPAIRGTDTNTGIFFPAADTIAFAEGGAEVARFDSNGNLGIGTSSPSNKLQVSGSAGSTVARFTDGANGTFLFQFASSESRIQDGGANNLWVYDNSGQNSKFYTNNTERMRIDSSGFLCVGTTNAINSTGHIYRTTASGDCFRITNNSGATGVSLITFRWSSSNTEVGYIVTNGTGVTYGTASDYRLKENVSPMTGALDKVALLKPCTYTWKADGSAGQGFIAHELAEVCPDAVVGQKDAVNEDGSIKSQAIDTSFLVATLTAAIQEQQAIITSQTNAITALEARLTALEQV